MGGRRFEISYQRRCVLLEILDPAEKDTGIDHGLFRSLSVVFACDSVVVPFTTPLQIGNGVHNLLVSLHHIAKRGTLDWIVLQLCPSDGVSEVDFQVLLYLVLLID